MSSLFGTAYNRAATMPNAVSAFSKTGICPLNPNIFTDVDFAPSQTTEILFVPTTNESSQDALPRVKLPAPQAGTSIEGQTFSNSISLVSPKDIMPIPHFKKNMCPSLRRRKTAILTDSPYKNELAKKATPSVSKIKFKSKGKGIGKKANKENCEEDSKCLFCGEKYSQTKSTDEWYQCTACLKWAHESCIGCSEQELLFFVCKNCE
ncbi:unnamed protein product [Parnassius mnemosyne]|uniref:PHD-type domain-containing protein n=1 Tax=Parnassius mnemosyne TaxID=213953 RepID=A0AAV1LM64_9NEOP